VRNNFFPRVTAIEQYEDISRNEIHFA